jgi:hypothetical protein
MPGERPGPARSRWETAGLIVFAALTLGVILRLWLEPDPRRQNLYLKVFAPAAQAFVDGRDLYTLEGGFRYPPVAAAATVPFTWLPDRLGSVVWRLALLGVLVLAVRATFRAGFPTAMSSRERGVFWLLLAPAVLASLNNGQPNTLFLGLLLFATVGVLAGRPRTAAAAVTVSTAVKVYPFAHGLVLAALEPRLVLGLVVGLAITVLLPFALQDPAYVWGQYAELVALLRAEDRTTDLASSYRDLRLLAAAVGVHLPAPWFLALQASLGAGIAALCVRLQRANLPRAVVLEHALALTVCWFMLLGPATERVTYALLGPSLAWPLLRAIRGRSLREIVAFGAVNALYLGDHLMPTMSRAWQAEHPWSRCVLPATALFASGLFVARAFGDLQSTRVRVRGSAPSLPAG